MAAVLSRSTDILGDSAPQWGPLTLFNLYRVGIAGLFLALISTVGPRFLGEHNMPLFVLTTELYLVFAITGIIASHYQWPAFNHQVLGEVSVDIVAITLLMHASGGVTSGLGMLLIAVIAGASLLLNDRPVLFSAAIASLAVLLEAAYADIYGVFDTTAYTQTGLLGAALFATALLGIHLAGRARQSQALAAARGLDLADLAKLNEHIVNRMQSGILVVDDNADIKLMNQAAWDLMGQPGPEQSTNLATLSHGLHKLHADWAALRHTAGYQTYTGKLSRAPALELRVRFARVGARKEDRGSVIYLDDNADISRQVQETKLASLGRLTASIAHEIRNPLGAISHAAQLLGEAPELSDPDRRMIGIIHEHTGRLNRVIQNILGLSRKEQSHPEAIHLRAWLSKFTEEFGRIHELAPDWAAISITPRNSVVHMDANHLHQVLWNLCTNAAKYGTRDGQATVELQGGQTRDSNAPWLDIIDQGPGIDPEAQAQLFEPFFTTSDKGTGLGLYISRELCQSNGGNLSYVPVPVGGSCFRIHFPIHVSQTEDASGAACANR